MHASTGYDVTIVCTTDDHQSAWWMERLSSTVCSKSKVLAVSEDWSPGGAGNGLGTLYAFKKAHSLAKEKFGASYDLLSLLSTSSISVGLFHTAGKGTRLAPLPASENNNKPGVKLPATVNVEGGSPEPITILEAVIKQTGVYASSRKGRLSVYWGDQIFIPSEPFTDTPTHHVDIMCTLGDMVGRDEWISKGLDKYGVIAVSSNGEAAQVEKVDYETATNMLQSLGNIHMVGPSLGSFSVSAVMLSALSDEFSAELSSKSGKFDTDPHFWMPMTLKKNDYIQLMGSKGVDAPTATSHYDRITAMKSKFTKTNDTLGLFGAVNVGREACWWDYGQLKLYSINNLKLLGADSNSDLLRAFLDVKSRVSDSEVEKTKIDSSSCIFASHLSTGSVTNSVISCVNATSITANGAILVNVTAKSIKAAKNSIIYNVIDDSEEGVVVNENEVRVGVFDKNAKQSTVMSSMTLDGGKVWKEVVAGNEQSFEDIHTENRDSDVGEIVSQRSSLHERLKLSLLGQ